MIQNIFQVIMLTRTLLSNAVQSLGHVHHSRSKLMVQVCYFKQCSVLNDKNTSTEDLESLAASAQDEADLGVSFDSELVYFPTEPEKLEGHQKLYKQKTSLRQKLAYTNKALFGPLLETSAEKKRRIKAENDDTEKTQNRKEKQKPEKDKASRISMEPLLWKPGNSHFLGVFPGDRTSKYANKISMHKVKIEPLHLETIDDQHSRSEVAQSFRNKKLHFKKSSKHSVKINNFSIYDSPKPQKILVSSWSQGKEPDFPSFTGDSTFDICKQSSGDEFPSRNVSGNYSYDDDDVNMNIHIASTPSSTKKGNDQEMHNQESITTNTSLLSIDNSNFPAVPNILDFEVIENFPLLKEQLPASSVPNHSFMKTGENIVNIGIFDGGYQKLPSVSKILEATMPGANRIALEK